MTCPDGHTSSATDFCDVCGAPIGATATPVAGTGAPAPDGGPSPAPGTSPAPTPSPAPAAASTTPCPSCGTAVSSDALFCESCGRDMVTGQLPRAADPAAATSAPPAPRPPTGWVAEVWVDEEWFAARGEGRCPTVGEPATFPVADGSLIGRTSRSRNIHPDVDCLADGSVSARQALLGLNGTIWTVTDLGSTNGTFVAHAGGPLPAEPIEPNQAVELEPGDRILIGAHTRVVILADAAATPSP